MLAHMTLWKVGVGIVIIGALGWVGWLATRPLLHAPTTAIHRPEDLTRAGPNAS